MLLTLLGIAAVSAPITAVTVYEGQARVERTASVALTGPQTVELPPLPRAADPASVRLEAEGAEVQSIELRPRRAGAGEAPPAALEIERLDAAIASAERQQTLFEELTAVGGWKPALPEDTPLAAGKLDPRGWRRALDFLARFCDRLDGQRRALDRRLHDLRAERALHGEAGASTVEHAGTGWQVVATVSGRGAARLRLSYLVPGAAWKPSYEVRLDPARAEVALALSAVVTQQTGEDWPGARLTLSTAQPARLATPPRLTAWRIGERQRFVPEPERVRAAAPGPAPRASWDRPGPGTLQVMVLEESGLPLRGVQVSIRGGSGEGRRAYTDAEGFCRFPGLGSGTYEVAASAPKLRTVTQRGVRVTAEQGAETTLVMEVERAAEEVRVVEKTPVLDATSATLKEIFDSDLLAAGLPARPAARRSPTISLAPPPSEPPRDPEVSFAALWPDTVPSGPSPRRVPLQSWTFPATLQRTLYPALAPEAFLLAKLPRPTEAGTGARLPAGEAALFVGDDPAGTTELQPLALAPTFELPLGLDRDLRAIRRVTVATRQEGIFRKQEISRHSVTIEITNPHPLAVRAAVHDQIPIAGDERVASRLLTSTPPATWDREKGTLTWQLDLRGARVTRVSFEYELRCPKGFVLRQGGVAR
jgi:hypothetical protein